MNNDRFLQRTAPKLPVTAIAPLGDDALKAAATARGEQVAATLLGNVLI